MALLQSIRDHHYERRIFVGRIVLSIVVATLLLGTVVSRLVQLQVVNYEQYAEKAQGNRIRTQPVSPIRGLVLDRSGRVLAENLPAYQLELIPEQVEDIRDTLSRLAELGLIERDDIEELIAESRETQRFRPVTLNPRLDDEEISRFAVQRARFPGVDFKPRLVRHYPDGEAIAHAVGYVGRMTVEDLQRVDTSRYAGTTQAGQTGLEASYESRLHGDAGFRHIVTNARGRQITTGSGGVIDALPEDELPDPGDNLLLTLDIELQTLATELMKDRRGAIVAIDPNNGDILAMISAPSFDPNMFAVGGMSRAQYASVAEDPDRPLFNRAVRGIYPPGSTIKPMLALAALESGATNLTRKIMCRGYFTLPNSTHRYRDWKPEGHGPIDIHQAVSQSCDVYFYEISNEIGIDRMHDYLVQFGLGYQTGVDIGGERSGLVPSTTWKREAFRSRDDKRWYDGETVIASIGQGYMNATPLQLAAATGALGTRGMRFRPRLVAGWQDPLTGEVTELEPAQLPTVDIKNEFYWDDVIASMNSVLQDHRGTAFAAGRDLPYRVAGKSGTSQVFSVGQDEEYNEEEIEERLRDHALFISFAPLENPAIAVAVIVENGSSGSTTAAPIAMAIMDHYLEHKNAAQ
ncbi:MAG: penicillin-binding protein 2 [Woeseiaceae bacterium]|nr:penicillin-binding protein 2 [Woeseiaceae bacterium]